MSAKLSSKLNHPLRLMAWGSALMLLLTPLIAMQFTDEVHWTPLDFIVMGILIGTVGLAIEKAVSLSPHTTYRIGVTILLLSLFLLTWTNLAVGIIGRDENQRGLESKGSNLDFGHQRSRFIVYYSLSELLCLGRSE